ncbi:hypothetical protein AB1L30_06140 [Bremerella sp. JC817]|uniref:hypothetical protein n=1 Tax=Bremerella sp. JC817 TaxID=3231756 RepID=UPI00345AF8E1
MRPELMEALRYGVFPVTSRIAIGRFASPARFDYLQQHGYTHILNVSDAASLASTADAGFADVKDMPLDDFMRIPTAEALAILGTLHAFLNIPDSKVYLHCIAGQNRCPTILWLYMIALGLSEDEARQRIVHACPDAQPGHRTLVDQKLIDAVRDWGVQLGYIDRDDLLQSAYR